MTLSAHNWPKIVNTSSHDFMQDYIIPALQLSTTYDRGVGYFSSGWLQVASTGLLDFAARKGRARWITSPILSQADWNALRLGYEAKNSEIVYNAIKRNIDEISVSLQGETASILAWMIADGILSFRIAIPRGQLNGDFHDKFGIFSDDEKNRLAFRGSYNESIQGLHNYESISFYPSWEPVLNEYCTHEASRFEDIWNDNDPNIRVYDIPEIAKTNLLKLRTDTRPYDISNWSFSPSSKLKKQFSPPDGIQLRNYQKDAVNAWFKNNGKGILQIATGGGKTLTSLFIAHTLWKNTKRLVIIVTSPYIVLAQQWQKEMQKFGLDPITCYGSVETWKSTLEQAISSFTAGAKNIVAISVTNSTFRNSTFQHLIKYHAKSTLLIADEVHNTGSEQFRTFANNNIIYRLGLSATPERRFDEEGNSFISKYFGKTVYEFDLKDAINADILTPYYYYPILINLTDEEADEYYNLTNQIGRLYIRKPNDPNISYTNQKLKRLMIMRSRLIANARNKLLRLSDLISNLSHNLRHTLIYCGDGTIDKDDDIVIKQVEEICKILGDEHNLRVRKYTSKECSEERSNILTSFEQGKLDAIIAIKCLDEGVDIPLAKTGIILASSSNPRQYIQRRGRLLRRAKNKDYSIIYDFIVAPPSLSGLEDEASFNIERKLFQRELVRICEFCDTAENGAQALLTLLELRKDYNLLTGDLDGNN